MGVGYASVVRGSTELPTLVISTCNELGYLNCVSNYRGSGDCANQFFSDKLPEVFLEKMLQGIVQGQMLMFMADKGGEKASV